MACLLLPAPAARAQSPGGSYSAPAYSGGTYTWSDYTGTTQPAQNYGPQTGGTYGSGSPSFYIPNGKGGAEDTGAISTTFTWNNGGNANNAQPSAIVTETCTATRQAPGSTVTGVCDDGLGPTASGSTATATGTRYTPFSAPTGPLTLSCSPHVTAASTGNATGYVSVSYQATASPVTISLTGTINDTSGVPHILIGQECQASLNVGGISSSWVSNIQWSAAGNTLQGWTGANSGSTAVVIGKANPYTLKQSSLSDPGPAWYWSDVAGTKVVTCTATITPPAGQGSPFTVTSTQNVSLDVPTWSESDSPNPTRIDSLYSKVVGPALWAGSTTINQNGSQWNDAVTIPPKPYTTTGGWAHLQIITVNGTHSSGGTSTPVPNNGVQGLDGSYPYGAYFRDNGVVSMEGDSPGINLLDAYDTYALNYSFDLYVMYFPPDPPGGGSATPVPLTKLTWTWNPTVHRPVGGWAKWPTGTAPGGNPVVPAGTRCIDEPTWTTTISEH